MTVAHRMMSRALNAVFARMDGASFAVTNCDGDTTRYGPDEALFTIRFNDESVFDLSEGDLLTSFGEAYMDGRLDVEGDLAALVSLALRSGLVSASTKSRGLSGAAMRAFGSRRSVDGAKKNVARHYDLGNEFFRLWLDDSMTYSCAYFRTASDSLEQAQRQKLDHSLHKLRLRPHETLLDIGCGWGALVMRAAERYQATATGITLSDEQYSAVNAAIVARRLQEAARARLADYEALAEEGRQFDKIVSIGMIEHVGRDNLAGFVRAVAKLLKPGGLALLHSITSVREGSTTQWFERHIFPGAYIPTLPELITHLAADEFRILDVENLAPHYRLTLDGWSERFERAVPAVLEDFDERFVRMWRLYLRASSAAFREGALEVHQILVSHGQPTDLPLTREDIYRETKASSGSPAGDGRPERSLTNGATELTRP